MVNAGFTKHYMQTSHSNTLLQDFSLIFLKQESKRMHVFGICLACSVCVLSVCCEYVRTLCFVLVYFFAMCVLCVCLCNVKATECAVTFCLSTAESLWVRRPQLQPALYGPNTTRACLLIGTDSSTEREETRAAERENEYEESDMMWSCHWKNY